jgi:heme exporter protein A
MGAEALTDSPASGQAEASPTSGRALAIEGLVRRFGEREALRGVTTALDLDRTLAVFGPNGAGKTTFLRVLSTLLLPHAGRVSVLGLELPREAHALRPLVGLAGHEPLLYRELTGRENLDFYARLYEIPDRRERVQRAIDAIGMGGRADEPIRTLSRGMVQRLSLARAVLHRPQLLLLDEPRGGLDPDAADLVEPLIGRASGLTRVIVTHDLERGLGEADRVLGLRAGRAVIEAPAADVTVHDLRDLYRGSVA